MIKVRVKNWGWVEEEILAIEIPMRDYERLIKIGELIGGEIIFTEKAKETFDR